VVTGRWSEDRATGRDWPLKLLVVLVAVWLQNYLKIVVETELAVQIGFYF